MKLLLTSAGLANVTITNALKRLLGASLEGIPLAFVPTAANVEAGDKSWVVRDLVKLTELGCVVDIVDISALPKTTWLPRLQAAKVLFFEGGNTFHLMHWIQKSDLVDELPQLLQTRVYIGVSAGSCVTGPTIYNSVQNLFGETYELEIKQGLGLVDFQTIPHLNSAHFDKIREPNLRAAAKDLAESVYALDDDSAIVVDDNSVEVVSEGEWHKFN